MARISLTQEGNPITGTFQPGDGEPEGRLGGSFLTGTWRWHGDEGKLEFASSGEGHETMGDFISAQPATPRKSVRTSMRDTRLWHDHGKQTAPPVMGLERLTPGPCIQARQQARPCKPPDA